MNAVSFPRKLLPVLLFAALAGCSLAPKYERPAAPIPAVFPNAEAVGAHADAQSGAKVADSDIAHSANLGWKEFFADPRLRDLIGLALDNNRDMRIALARVEEARAQYGIADSERLPTFGVGGNASVTGYPEALRPAGPDSPSVTRSYMAGVAMTTFELDFFGRVRNLSEAARQQFLATAQAQRTVQINLVSQVAEAYFRLRTAQQLQELMDKTLQSREATLRLVQARYDTGVASALDLQQARGQVETVRADQQSIRRTEAQALNALQLLVGAPLPDDMPPPAQFGRDQILASIPVGLPSELLTRRPDIIGAEHALIGANASIGAARAAFFPNISITGMLGFASPQLGGLFSGGNRYWQYQPQLQIPIFNSGIAGNLDLAEARKNLAVAEYEKTIQTAFREVADALAGEATYWDQLEAMRALEATAAEALRLANLRYETGVDSFLQVQSAEVNLYSVQQAFLQVGMESLLNRVALYKALGGGWLAETADPVAAEGQGNVSGQAPVSAGASAESL